MTKKEILSEIIIASLVILFLYTSTSKYFDFAAFKRAMHNQPFPSGLATLFIWTLPPAEILTAVGLMIERTRTLALSIFLALMVLFTGYIALIVLHVFPRVPCSCGGGLQSLGWTQHLLFNIIFIALAIGVIVFRKQGRRPIKDVKPA